ncbi:hypothetical protein [Nannocystis punicea]|uniref:Uncharacterized protein n=1 Tax=Nannocystis punicea TaxID=2995304 RepID=A0ABY7HHQ5_9BACT|nr:hypothetical protein [Nannocystis poenicansa]WAS98848.1 hypothetical protein O0S08_22180 [Nannocystis poenicansa]
MPRKVRTAAAPPTRTDFEAALQGLGYAAPEPFPHDVCRHRGRPRCAVYTMPSADCRHDPRSFGDLGWRVYEGCEACCMEVGGVLFCGGLYEHVRVFRGQVDITGTTGAGLFELQPAHELLP